MWKFYVYGHDSRMSWKKVAYAPHQLMVVLPFDRLPTIPSPHSSPNLRSTTVYEIHFERVGRMEVTKNFVGSFHDFCH